ncbi:MAG: hypothetical protein KIT00_02855 [Rhodospirillales bacterium]|nr:hypothetical protein [Rhodospirillales bacterium]
MKFLFRERRQAVKVEAEEPWSWMLYADGSARFLSVVCGTVGLYEIDLALDAEEVAQYGREGVAFIARLAAAVMSAPGDFQLRHLEDFHARPDVRAAITAWRGANGH